MLRKILFFIGFIILWLLPFAPLVEAGHDSELGHYCGLDTQYRDAADADDLIERGRASVTDSPAFPDGIRLSALAVEGEQEFEPGLASAIYRFVVPPSANYLKISVHYRDVSKDGKVAGRLWIKTTDKNLKRELEPGEEAPFYGDTFVLRSNRTSETICVPSARHVEANSLEVHIVAEGRDCLDVKYIRVEYLERVPTEIRIIHHRCDDYWSRWPPYRYVYHYYYWGPCYWPRSCLAYVCWDWPCDYYWYRYRPWYRIYVRVYYSRFPRWYHRYSIVYDCHPDDPPVKKRARLRRWVKGRRARTGKQREETLANRNIIGRRLQASRRSARFKSRPVISSYISTKQIRKKNQERLQVRKGPPMHRARSAFRPISRATSRSYIARTRGQIERRISLDSFKGR